MESRKPASIETIKQSYQPIMDAMASKNYIISGPALTISDYIKRFAVTLDSLPDDSKLAAKVLGEAKDEMQKMVDRFDYIRTSNPTIRNALIATVEATDAYAIILARQSSRVEKLLSYKGKGQGIFNAPNEADKPADDKPLKRNNYSV